MLWLGAEEVEKADSAVLTDYKKILNEAAKTKKYLEAWKQVEKLQEHLRMSRKQERRRVLGVSYGESVEATLVRWEREPLQKKKEYQEIRERLAWVEGLGWWSWLVSWLLPMNFWRALRQEVEESYAQTSSAPAGLSLKQVHVGESVAASGSTVTSASEALEKRPEATSRGVPTISG